MSFSVGIRLSVSSSQFLMSISWALQEAKSEYMMAARTSSEAYIDAQKRPSAQLRAVFVEMGGLEPPSKHRTR